MRLPWNRRLSNAKKLAELAHVSDFPTAMELLVSGISHDERVAMARELLPHLPGIMGATVLGNTFTTENWAGLRGSMTAAEKRPMINRGLIEHGREHFELDLGLVPASTTVGWQLSARTSLIKHPRLTLPDKLSRNDAVYDITMTASGDYSFELNDTLYVPDKHHRDHVGTQFARHSAVVLGGMHDSRTGGKRFSSLIRHGRPLYVVIDQQPIEIEHRDPHSVGMQSCYLANIALDGEQVFWNPAWEN